jgi:hypothetical protein
LKCGAGEGWKSPEPILSKTKDGKLDYFHLAQELPFEPGD